MGFSAILLRMSSNRRHILGAYGESLAAKFLEDLGYEVVERNWRCPQGELDLIARDKDAWVFVEVKTRRSQSANSGLEAVDEVKQQRMRRAIREWCRVREVSSLRLRIDAISVFISGSVIRFEHLKQVG